tara:strand:+ start:644 stop:1855 length:1212 start_codon:yes stop_codon:yes gene_type:complete
MKEIISNIISSFNNLMDSNLMFACLVICLSIFSYLITKFILSNIVSRFFRKTSTQIDDMLIDNGFLNRLSYTVPLIIIYTMVEYKFGDIDLISRIIYASFSIIGISVIHSVLTTVNEIYSKSKFSDRLNIKSYVQIVRLIVTLFGIVIVIAFLSNQSPWYLLSGLGALTAVLMLIFKDTILSFVSSIQITSSDLFKVGDWVEAPQFGADGDVVDIALHTIRIQNWDKTITTIPTHKLIDSSFKNWRGMSESGGRRIKRSINIDLNSVKFCDSEMIEKYKKINILSDYIDSKKSEIDDYNKSKEISNSILNGRALTNIGTYRAYIQNYLRSNANIHPDMTFLIRQLSPGDNGVPLEVYVFSNNINWVEYESIQSDIFDHLIASVKEFDLVLFQNPTGNDFKKIS